MNLAVIPARGGSKRIPRKNVKLFFDRPMLAYSIEAALESQLFERVIVSTDDLEIAEVAKSYGAQVPFMRPKNLADDMTATVPVIKHAIAKCEQMGDQFDVTCCIYATAPFIEATNLVQAFYALKDQQVEYAFPVTEFDYPVQRALKETDNGLVTMVEPENYLVRSQDLPKRVHDVGQFYMGTTSAWLEEKPILTSRSVGIPISRRRAQDIDTEDDWVMAEALFKLMQSGD